MNLLKMNKYVWVIVGMGLCLVLPLDVLAQSLSDFESELENEASTFENIAKRILELVLIVGVVGVVWAYASKDQEAKKYLTFFIIAIVVAGIGRAVLL